MSFKYVNTEDFGKMYACVLYYNTTTMRFGGPHFAWECSKEPLTIERCEKFIDSKYNLDAKYGNSLPVGYIGHKLINPNRVWKKHFDNHQHFFND